MVPKSLYHGSGKEITSRYLNPNKPLDNSKKENCICGVYATDRRDIAIGMALTTEKYTKSFGDYSKKVFKAIFVRGKPKQKFVYIYKVSSNNFIEKPKGSHQWICKTNVLIIEKKKLLVSKLDESWRKASKEEKRWYYSIKNS